MVSKSPKYSQSAKVAKGGTRFVREVVEASGSIFHKIELDNDLGIDGLIELVIDGTPAHKQCAVQIKSGESYLVARGTKCRIPVGKHRDYWTKYPLPVIGVVYSDKKKTGYWVDLKAALKADPRATAVTFKITRINEFDATSFAKIFVQAFLGETPTIDFDLAQELAQSGDFSERRLGLRVIFRKFPNRKKTWEILTSIVRTSEASMIPPETIYYLAHIPWHGDIFGFGELPTSETREFAGQLISSYGRSEITKLLLMIDEDSGITRGSLGQSIEAVVSSVPTCDSTLLSIATDSREKLRLRECAVFILAMHLGKAAIPTLMQVAEAGSAYASEISAFIAETGYLNPYN